MASAHHKSISELGMMTTTIEEWIYIGHWTGFVRRKAGEGSR
jgi:hypothetical protein